MPPELLSLAGLIVMVVVVLVLAYFATRFVATRGLGVGFAAMGSTRRLKLLDQLALGKDQRLVVAQAGERFLLLGVTPAGITLLAEFSAEEAAQWRQEEQGVSQPLGFKEALLDQLHRHKKK